MQIIRRTSALLVLSVIVAVGFLASPGDEVPPSEAAHVGPAGSIHIEIATNVHIFLPTATAFDFDAQAYVNEYPAITDSAVDIRLGTDSILGYREILALNGAKIADLGVTNFASVDCAVATGASYAASAGSTAVVPTINTVYLVRLSATGMYSKLLLTGLDFTAPNGLVLDYENLTCPPDLTGRWAAVYSTSTQTHFGDCQGGLSQTGSSLTDGGDLWSCESNEVPVAGYTNVNLAGTLSGASVTGNLAGTVNFSGTFSADGRSGEGTWTGPNIGTYKTAKQRSTPGGPVSAIARTAFGENSFLTFPTTSTAGNTAIIGSPTTAYVNRPQFLFGGQIYHVITTVSPTGPGTGPYGFCIGYPGTSATTDIVGGVFETALQIAHLEESPLSPGHFDWVWYRDPPSDPVANRVCASVDSLSEFALVAPGSSVGGLVSILSDGDSSGARVWPYVAMAALSVSALGLVSLWMQRRRRLN